MLLQIHDFAEDNRPDNYSHLQEAIGESDPDRLGVAIYPQGQGVHYATLTERDAGILRTAGVAAERLHVLPNPAAEFGTMPSHDEARERIFGTLGLPPTARLVVYPVRGIRRKNLGEMLLLSALAPEGTYFAVTLRPKNPIEAASFDRWRMLAESLDLPCRFDIGSPREEGGYGCDFKDALAAADAVLTTSVAEGFGMVFLEAWLAGKPLIGRDLPEITAEFKAAGMRFHSLWSEFRPAACLEADFAQLTPAEQARVIRDTRRPSVELDLGFETARGDIAHNAAIDMGFLDNELALLGSGYGRMADRVRVQDSLELARQRFPGQRNSLDALCKRLDVDNSQRQLHGALLDAQLLAEVYLALTAGQGEIGFDALVVTTRADDAFIDAGAATAPRPRVQVSMPDLQAHQLRVAAIAKQAGVDLWRAASFPEARSP